MLVKIVAQTLVVSCFSARVSVSLTELATSAENTNLTSTDMNVKNAPSLQPVKAYTGQGTAAPSNKSALSGPGVIGFMQTDKKGKIIPYKCPAHSGYIGKFEAAEAKDGSPFELFYVAQYKAEQVKDIHGYKGAVKERTEFSIKVKWNNMEPVHCLKKSDRLEDEPPTSGSEGYHYSKYRAKRDEATLVIKGKWQEYDLGTPPDRDEMPASCRRGDFAVDVSLYTAI
jgi:hypothetical protein